MSHEASRTSPIDATSIAPDCEPAKATNRSTCSRLGSGSALSIAVVVALIGFASDQISKALAFAPSRGHAHAREIIPGLFTGVLSANDGAVANLGGGRAMTPVAFAMWSLAMIGAAVCWTCDSRVRVAWPDAAFGGILAGGMLGNAADRLALGYVRDFLVAACWPSWVFNLADVLVVVGAMLLLVSGLSRFIRSHGVSARLEAGDLSLCNGRASAEASARGSA